LAGFVKIISFTGGYGAQIISSAAYFHLERANPGTTGAYFGYFSQSPHLATPGVSNDISHWEWEMDSFGIEFKDFHQPMPLDQSQIVWDGPEKLEMGFAGMRDPHVASRFPVVAEATKLKAQMFGSDRFACLHVRRGDYVNVASYLVSDEAFLQAARRVSGLVSHLFVVSDSALSETILNGLGELKINCVSSIGGAPHLIHGLMRLSDILICSNSQFSLTAAALRGNTSLTLYPSRHDGDPKSYSNEFLDGIRDFQVITRL
jgi:hypothetical protein